MFWDSHGSGKKNEIKQVLVEKFTKERVVQIETLNQKTKSTVLENFQFESQKMSSWSFFEVRSWLQRN